MERLRVKQAYKEIERVVVIWDNSVERDLFLAQRVKVHVVMVGQGLNLRQIERREADSRTHQDRFRSLASGQFENLILPDSDAVRFSALYGFKEQIEWGHMPFIFLAHLGAFQHAHDHREVLLVFRGFLKQHEDDRLQECGFGFGPERIGLVAALRRGGLDQVVDQLQHVLFVAQIAEWIIAVRLLQIHKVQNAHVVALLFEVAARGKQHFRFGVCYDIIGVCGQDVRQHKTACFGCAAAADDQHVEGAAVLVRIQTEPDVLRQRDAVFLRELRIDGCGCGPRRRAVFLAVAGPALIRPIKQNCHAISGKADEDGRQAFVRPYDIRRLLQCAGQIPQQLRQTAAKGLRQQEGKPDNGYSSDMNILLIEYLSEIELKTKKPPTRQTHYWICLAGGLSCMSG